MNKPIFDEPFVTKFISEMKNYEELLDEASKKLNKVLNSSSYLGGNLCSSSLQSLFSLNSLLESFLNNVLASYNAFLEDTGISVSELEKEGLNNDTTTALLFDVYLSRCSTLAQNDPKWKELGYEYKDHAISGNGCGPSSLTNQLIATFGVTDPNVVVNLYKEVIALTEQVGLNWMNEYFMNPNSSKYKRYTSLNNLVNNFPGQIIPVTSKTKAQSFIENYNFESGKQVVIVGKYSFSQKPNPNSDAWDNGNVIDLVNALYKKGVNANLYFGSLAVGTESLPRPFRGGAGGHYVSATININEFCEEGIIYLLDSYPKNLAGESKFKLNYAFAGKDYHFKKFNEAYNVERISDNVLKIQLKNGEKFNSKNMSLIGLTGGNTITLVYDGGNNNVPNSIDYSELNEQISSFVPSEFEEETIETTTTQNVATNQTTTNITGNNSLKEPNVIVEEKNTNAKEEEPIEEETTETTTTQNVATNQTTTNITGNNSLKEPNVQADTKVPSENNYNNHSTNDYIGNNDNSDHKNNMINTELEYLLEYIFKNNENPTFNANTKITLGNSTFLWKDIVNLYLSNNGMAELVKEINVDNGYVTVTLLNGIYLDFGNNITFAHLSSLLSNLKKVNI